MSPAAKPLRNFRIYVSLMMVSPMDSAAEAACQGKDLKKCTPFPRDCDRILIEIDAFWEFVSSLVNDKAPNIGPSEIVNTSGITIYSTRQSGWGDGRSFDRTIARGTGPLCRLRVFQR
jgi:hypothetical protein